MTTEIPEFTTVVAVDTEHLHELAAVFPTWWHFKPEIFQRPIWVVRDADVSASEILRATRGCVDRILDISPTAHAFENQREKMLTAIVRACANVETPYYLKLDTDAVATEPGDWILPQWFDFDPVFVASPWGYTKPAAWMPQLDAWASAHPNLRDCRPPAYRMIGNTARCQRMISWCMFGKTKFARYVSEDLTGGVVGRLPVPSQDTLLWYIAERLRLPYVRVRMGRRGWRHVFGLRRIQEAVRAALLKHAIPENGGIPEPDYD